MEKILQLKPDDASALNFMGYTLAQEGKDIQKAEELVRKALEIKPDDGYILDSLAWVLHKKGLDDEALEYLQKASAKVKGDPIVAEHLGDLLLLKGRKAEAAAAYKKSLEMNPDNLVVQGKLKKVQAELEPEAK